VAYELAHSKPHIKIAAAQTLGKIGSEEGIPALKEALQDDDQEVRIAAVRALGEIKETKSMNALITALDNANRYVRDEAANVLEQKADEFRNLQDPKAVDALIIALNDNNRNVRTLSAKLLGAFKDPRATVPLIKALEDEEYDVREQASRSLQKIKDPMAINPLVSALKSENPDVRAHVVQTLGGFRDHRALEPLMETIEDPDPGVRVAAIQVLGTIGESRAITSIIEALDDYDDKVRLQAVNTLAHMKTRQAIQPFVEKISDSSENVRIAAGQALLDMSWKPANKKEEGIRCLIQRNWARCIELGEPAVEPLVDELQQEDSSIKIPVARTLGELKHVDAVEPLLEYLDSAKTMRDREEQAEVYETVTTSLTDIGPQSIPLLLPKLTDWHSGRYVADVLKEFKFVPRSDEELIHYLVARRAKEQLTGNWGLTRKILLNDIKSKQPQKVENALYAFIGIGESEVINDLVSTLNRNGDIPLAEAYLNSGNETLVQSAVSWAQINGFKVHEFKKGAKPVEWGQL
jgi:HEAT repeat protein